MSPRRLEDLFERFRRTGEAGALAVVFDEVAPELLRVARHLAHDRAEAEDLVQATFVAAIEKRTGFDAERELRPWLTGILLNEASRARRARARAFDPARLDSRTIEDPAETLVAREIADTVAFALAKLSSQDREVLVPLLLDGRRAVEIARELGRRPDTVHMRIHRGLVRLRKLLPASFALGAAGAIVGLGNARGLAAVRAEVLRCARRELAVGTGTAASTAMTGVGVALMSKKIAIGLAVALSLGIGGWLVTDEAVEIERFRPDAAFVTTEPVHTATAPSAKSAVPGARMQAASLRELPQAATHAPTALEIELVDDEHRPVVEARVALVDADGTVHGSTSDASGRCEFGASEGVGHLYIHESGRFPCRVKIGLAAGRHTIALPPGEELAGRLQLLDGGPPPEVVLQLSTDNPPEGWEDASFNVLVARTTLGSDGTFRFHGLPPGWSGMLLFPQELVLVVGGQPTRSSELVLAASATGLSIPVAYRPRVIGRFVDASNGLPIANASTTVRFTWSGGNNMDNGVWAGPDGRFTIPLTERTDVVAVAFDFSAIRSSDGRIAHSTVRREWKDAVGLFDAGDVECTFSPARELTFHVVDGRGSALPHARARVSELEAVSADEHGHVILPKVPLTTTSVTFVAPGHAIRQLPLTPETASPLEVVLEPTNRLTVVLPSEAAGRGDLKLHLVSREHLFGSGRSRMYDSDLRGTTVGTCQSATGDDGTKEGYVAFAFSDDGRVEVEGVRTGIPFRVLLLDAGALEGSSGERVLAEVAVDSLGPTEVRRIDLSLDALTAKALHVLRGRVVDEEGRPLFQAEIARGFAADSFATRSGLDGTFELDIAGVDRLDVEVRKRGYVPYRVSGWEAASEQVLEARLARGRDLRVELVDARGRAIAGAEVTADVAGFGAPWRLEDGASGVFTLCDLPPGVAQVTASVAGRSYFSAHDAHGSVARIVLPEHGRLEVAWAWPAGAKGRVQYVALRPVGVEGAAQRVWTPHAGANEQHVFESVLPGEYTVGLESEPRVEQTDVSTPLHASVRVTIPAGETTRVELAP